jgi:NADH-quinone oxidoreductase subunit M
MEKENLKSILDLNRREMLLVVPLVVLIIFFGFYPAPLLDAIGPSVQLLVDNYSGALGMAANAAQMAVH